MNKQHNKSNRLGNLASKLSTKLRKRNRRKKSDSPLQLESLERREVFSGMTSSWALVHNTQNLDFYMPGGSATMQVSAFVESVEFKVSTSGDDLRFQDLKSGEEFTLPSSMVDSVDFFGSEGNDVFLNYVRTMPTRAWGYGGHDYLEGWNGADEYYGGEGNDTLKGYGGGDTLVGGGGQDSIDGMSGNDFVWGNAGNDELHGGTGHDQIEGGIDNDTIYGNDGNDTLMGDAGTDELIGGNDNDLITGGPNSDTIHGNAGNDTIVGDGGHDELHGGIGHDLVYGGGDSDTIHGDDGNDTLKGDAGNDELFGGNGHDAIYGGSNEDALHGNDGNDTLRGENGNDQLFGGPGTDRLFGDSGRDTLVSIDNGVSDILYGGMGQDSFWTDKNSNSYRDTIADADPVEWLTRVHQVEQFENGADRTLTGDTIAAPASYLEHIVSGALYIDFSRGTHNVPLFDSDGPSVDDINQGAVGDCWLMAGLGAAAHANPDSIRETIVELGDGTYAVELDNQFFRVDARLPAIGGRPVYADFGQRVMGTIGTPSLWAALIEKTFAHYRSGDNSYASLNRGNSDEVFDALGSRDYVRRGFSDGHEALQHINGELNDGKAVTVSIRDVPTIGWNWPGDHEYVVRSVNLSHPMSIELYNPHGEDDWITTSVITVNASLFVQNLENVRSAYVG